MINKYINNNVKSSTFFKESILPYLHPKTVLHNEHNAFRQLFEQIICNQIDNFIENEIINERYCATTDKYINTYAISRDIKRPLYSVYNNRPLTNEEFRNFMNKYRKRNLTFKTLIDLYQYDLYQTNTKIVEPINIDYITIFLNNFYEYDIAGVAKNITNYYTFDQNNFNLQLSLKNLDYTTTKPTVSIDINFYNHFINIEKITISEDSDYINYKMFIDIRNINHNLADPGFIDFDIIHNNEPIDIDIEYNENIRIDFSLPLIYDLNKVEFKISVNDPISKYENQQNYLSYKMEYKINSDERLYLKNLAFIFKNFIFPIECFTYETRYNNIFSQNYLLANNIKYFNFNIDDKYIRHDNQLNRDIDIDIENDPYIMDFLELDNNYIKLKV